MTSSIGSTVLGYPRIGPRRELPRAVKHYWAGEIGEAELRAVARELRARTWRDLSSAGLNSVPGNTFSLYDHVLDTATVVGAVPARYRELGLGRLDTYFAMARGSSTTGSSVRQGCATTGTATGAPGPGEVAPLPTAPWFGTRYHHVVPEIGPDTEFTLADHTPVTDYLEAARLGITTRPVLLGPVTFLLLADPAPDAPADFHPLQRLGDLLPVYGRLLRELCAAGAEWVQFDEPAFTEERSRSELDALAAAYRGLGELDGRPAILVAGSFGGLGPAFEVLAGSPVEGIAVDLVSAPPPVAAITGTPGMADKTLVAGLVDGRGVWRTDLDSALVTAATLLGSARDLAVSTSCSLLHVPYDVGAEPELDPDVRPWLAFAAQKVQEVVTLGDALTGGRAGVATALRAAREARTARQEATRAGDHRVRSRLAVLRPEHLRRPAYGLRSQAQERVVPEQADEKGGEPEIPHDERVRSLAERLSGVVNTDEGWVQTDGVRCVRPPVLFGDVASPVADGAGPCTPLEGCAVVGPVTLLAGSFVRDDQPPTDTAAQLALAVRDEVRALEAAGARMIRVDEPALWQAFRSGAPSRGGYVSWAVEAFRLATSGVADATRIRTHLAAGDHGGGAFGALDVVDAVAALEADVTCVAAESLRSEAVEDLIEAGLARQVEPGVYELSSPHIPEISAIGGALGEPIASTPIGRMVVRPASGTRPRSEAVPGARAMRGEYP